MSYADIEFYINFSGLITDEEAQRALNKASKHIDSLTFNRIKGTGFDNLTPFQSEIVKEVCCELADFEHENNDLINSVLSSYSINGVSMNFGDSWNVKIVKGIAIPSQLYEELSQTGLTCLKI